MRDNIFKIASGALLSQFIILASTPILTRIYSPESFGILAAFSASYALVVSFTTLKYDSAIILPKSSNSAIKMSMLVFLVSSTIVLMMAGFLFAVAFVRPGYFPPIALLMPMALWLGSLFTITQQWASRKNNFKIFVRSQVLGSIVNVTTCIVFGYVGGGAYVHLIQGFILGMLFAVVYSCINVGLSEFKRVIDLIGEFRLMKLKKRVLRYIRFPLYVLPNVVLSAVGQNSTPVVLAIFYSAAEVGYYTIGYRLLLLPSALLATALFESFRSEFSAKYREKQTVSTLFNSTILSSFVFAIVAFGTLVAFAPWLFPFVFGPKFENSSEIARVASWGAAAQFVGHPISSIFVLLRRMELGLVIQMITTLIPLAVLYVGANSGLDLETALLFYSITAVLGTAMTVIIAKNLCSFNDAMITKQ
jgi:lipopolysaccharide exporter